MVIGYLKTKIKKNVKVLRVNRGKIMLTCLVLVLAVAGIATYVYAVNPYVMDDNNINTAKKIMLNENEISTEENLINEYDELNESELVSEEIDETIVEDGYIEVDNSIQEITTLNNNTVNSVTNTNDSVESNASTSASSNSNTNTNTNTNIHTCNWISTTVVTKDAYTYEEDILEYTRGMYFQSIGLWMSNEEAKTIDEEFNNMLSEYDYPTCLNKVDFSGMQKYSALQKALTLSLEYSSQWWTDNRMIVVGTETITVPAETKVIQECSTCGKTK